jgi:hypothetical protein
MFLSYKIRIHILNKIMFIECTKQLFQHPPFASPLPVLKMLKYFIVELFATKIHHLLSKFHCA